MVTMSRPVYRRNVYKDYGVAKRNQGCIRYSITPHLEWSMSQHFEAPSPERLETYRESLFEREEHSLSTDPHDSRTYMTYKHDDPIMSHKIRMRVVDSSRALTDVSQFSHRIVEPLLRHQYGRLLQAFLTHVLGAEYRIFFYKIVACTDRRSVSPPLRPTLSLRSGFFAGNGAYDTRFLDTGRQTHCPRVFQHNCNS